MAGWCARSSTPDFSKLSDNNPFNPFKSFKSLKPPPSFDVTQDRLSSPASRGRTKEGD